MFDDLRRNFLMNPGSGLKIRPFKNAHTSRSTDKELLKLSAYLKKIATLTTFESLDHKHWESFLIKIEATTVLKTRNSFLKKRDVRITFNVN